MASLLWPLSRLLLLLQKGLQTGCKGPHPVVSSAPVGLRKRDWRRRVIIMSDIDAWAVLGVTGSLRARLSPVDPLCQPGFLMHRSFSTTLKWGYFGVRLYSIPLCSQKAWGPGSILATDNRKEKGNVDSSFTVEESLRRVTWPLFLCLWHSRISMAWVTSL